jgi:hypothetical protein
VPEDVTRASAQVLGEWRARVAAEYTSAAVTQHFVLWLMQLGAPPDLVDAGLAIVTDELVHSRMSHDVLVAAGGGAPPALDRATLGLERRRASLELDVLCEAVRVFCLGETVAVPLFAHLRSRCTVEVARAALDRILVDEVRHRDFGWDMLDWLLQSPLGPDVPSVVEAALPSLLEGLDVSYGRGNRHVVADDGSMPEADRAWGLAPPREYAEILTRALERDHAPRFAARGIRLPGGKT